MKTLTATAIALAITGTMVASADDSATSLSYIAYLERYATILPASQANSTEAVINMPLVPGDRVDTAREARMEIVLADGNLLWLDEYTTISLDAMAFSRDTGGDRTVLYLAEGTVMLEIAEHQLTDEPVRIDSQAATVYLTEIGLYRLQALRNGGLRVEVWQGLAEAATNAGGVLVRPESAAEVYSGEVAGVEPHLTWGDEFAHWVEQRRQIVTGESGEHVDARYERQSAQLDNYGNWVYLESDNSWAWQPTVGTGWSPYSAGRWYWTSTGWSWISYEPWGWLPYHYGSWRLSVGFGWVWSWQPFWSPAWVHWAWWPGYVGWCPVGFYGSWWWPRYYDYYGYSDWPYYPSQPGGAAPRQPSRRNVVPGGEPGGGGAQPREAADVRPRDLTLDVSGRVRVAEIDRQGWNVATDRDFASPHVSRLLRSGDDALRVPSEQMGVVMSGPLRTASPDRERPAAELTRVFRDVERVTDRDVTPVLGRADDLSGAEALTMVYATTFDRMSRRAVPETARSPASTTSPSRPTLNAGGASPMRTVDDASPTRGGGTSPSAASTLAYRNPYVSRARPSTVTTDPRTGRSGTSTLSPPARRAPTSSDPRGQSSPRPTSRVSPRSPTTRTSPRSPVVVPRTPGTSRPSPSTRAPSSTRRPSSSRRSSPSAPSRPRSSPSVRAPSGGRASPGGAAPRGGGGSMGSRGGGGAPRGGGARR